MATPFFVFTRNELIFLLALFLLGIITGAVLLNVALSRQIDQLILTNNDLKTRVDEQSTQIKQLEKNQYQHQYLSKLTIEQNTDLNKHTQQAIEAKIRKLLSDLPGRKISEINPILLWNIIDNRYITVEDNKYHLRLNMIYIIDGELTLYLKVKSDKSGEEPE